MNICFEITERRKKAKVRSVVTMSDRTSSTSRISTASLESIIQSFKQGRVRDTTKRNYQSVWKTFNNFFIRLDIKPDNWEDRIILFVGHLIECNRQSQTIRSYVSAIKAILLNDGIQVNEDRFLLNSLTRACKIRKDTVRTRLPIQKGLLKIIVDATNEHFLKHSQEYLASLYGTIFCTAYFGMFRVGELASGDHPVKVTDVHIAQNKFKIMFVLRTSKTHGHYAKPQTIKLSRNNLNQPEMCPYSMLRNYLDIRPQYKNKNEPFFVFRDYSPVKPAQVCEILRKMLKNKGFVPELYATHSLRAGRSLDLLRMNVSVDVIRRLGLWRSNAVYNYLKY